MAIFAPEQMVYYVFSRGRSVRKLITVMTCLRVPRNLSARN